MRLRHLTVWIALLFCVAAAPAQDKGKPAANKAEPTADKPNKNTKTQTASVKPDSSDKPAKPVGTIAPVKTKAAPPTAPKRRARRRINLKLPKLGAPKTRISAGTRGSEDDPDAPPKVTVLATDHVGLTSQTAPTLFWHLSTATDAKLIVAVIDTKTLKNVARVVIPGKHEPGIHGFDLAKHNVTLKPGVDYRWLVTVVTGERPTSKDPYASALIRRVKLSADDAKALAEATPEDRPYIVAQLGHWYDVLKSVHTQIVTDPSDVSWREVRAQLCDQADLPDVAAAERKLVKTPAP